MSVDAPSNPELCRAMVAVRDAPEEKLRPFLDALLRSTLIAIDDDGPLTIEADQEGDYLALFTDLIELHFFEPGARWLAVPAEQAIRKVVAGDYDGLVINPGQRSFELSRDDVTDFFDVS